jgi:hypothetical protein
MLEWGALASFAPTRNDKEAALMLRESQAENGQALA